MVRVGRVGGRMRVIETKSDVKVIRELRYTRSIEREVTSHRWITLASTPLIQVRKPCELLIVMMTAFQFAFIYNSSFLS